MPLGNKGLCTEIGQIKWTFPQDLYWLTAFIDSACRQTAKPLV